MKERIGGSCTMRPWRVRGEPPMRDLKIDELAQVYGAGGKGRSDCYSSCTGSKSRKRKSSKRKRKSSRKFC